MKNVVLASMALAALLVTPARAAEVAVKAPVYQAAPVLPYNWSGAYLGINVGGGWSRTPFVLDNPAVNLDFLEGGGTVAGGFIGYNYQVSPWFLVGLEGAGAWAQIKQVGQDCTIDVPASCTSNIKLRRFADAPESFLSESWFTVPPAGDLPTRDTTACFCPPGLPCCPELRHRSAA
jgi:opacity protein-like surface antigen